MGCEDRQVSEDPPCPLRSCLRSPLQPGRLSHCVQQLRWDVVRTPSSDAQCLMHSGCSKGHSLTTHPPHPPHAGLCTSSTALLAVPSMVLVHTHMLCARLIRCACGVLTAAGYGTRPQASASRHSLMRITLLFPSLSFHPTGSIY